MFSWLTWFTIPHFAQFTAVLFVVNIIIALAIIFLERKNPSATLAWIMILFLLPVVGILLYFLFSQHIARKKIFKLYKFEENAIHESLKEQIEEIESEEFQFATEEAELWKDMIRLNQTYGQSFYTQDNTAEILIDGKRKFHSLMKDIKNAKSTINIMYYIIKNDIVGKKLLKLLTEKAKEGVEVRLLMDAMGCRQINDRMLKPFIEAGGKRAYFFPPKFKVFNIRFNYRNHRKVVVIDGDIGYIGGFNIAREYLSFKKKFGYWRDTHLRMTGTSVQDINARFILDWRFASKEELLLSEAYYSDVLHSGHMGVQIVSSGPDSPRVAVKRSYMKMITSARKNIYLQTPYFVPDQSILESLKMAAQSGVDVRIMIPCMPDHIFVYWATYSYVGELIKSGGRVFIYDNGFLHAKTLVVDGEVASVGSANFDQRSFHLNFEANAFIYDSGEAGKLESVFEQDMQVSHELTLDLYEQRSLWIRCKEAIARLLSDIL